MRVSGLFKSILSLFFIGFIWLLSQTYTSVVQGDSNKGQIKNIIYMIPDGGGFALYDMASGVKENGSFVENYATSITQRTMYMKDFLRGIVNTKSNNNDVTDSAAAGTALATGYKTNNKYIGIDNNKIPHASILELAMYEGMSTGLVVTKTFFDATPATFASHTNTRDDSKIIANQIFNHNIDIVLGGASSNISTKLAKQRGYTIIDNKSKLDLSVRNAAKDTKIWSNMQVNNYFLYESEYEYDTTLPTLKDMVSSAISILDKKDTGFFLMVEGSKIDTGGHENNAVYTCGEFIAFDEAFKYAVEWVDKLFTKIYKYL